MNSLALLITLNIFAVNAKCPPYHTKRSAETGAAGSTAATVAGPPYFLEAAACFFGGMRR